jgi:hypothetical protein
MIVVIAGDPKIAIFGFVMGDMGSVFVLPFQKNNSLICNRPPKCSLIVILGNVFL